MKELSGKTGRIISSFKINKNKIIIEFDDSTFLKINKNTYLEFNLFINKRVDDNLLKSIKDFDEYSSSINCAIKLIKRYVYSKAQLINKLKLHKYNDNVIKKTIIYLNDKNLINDEELIKDIILTYINRNKGINYIKEKLIEKGFANQLINENLKMINEKEYIDKAITILINKGKQKDAIERNLISNGFDYELVKEKLDKVHFDNNLDTNLINEYKKLKMKYNSKSQIINKLLMKGYKYNRIISILGEDYDIH